MKAIRYHGPDKPFRIEQVDTPEPGPGQVRIQITAAGMCHTELHFLSGVLNLGIHPLTMGHEIVGKIDAVGSNVESARIGQRVIVYYYTGCGKCTFCLRGEEQICINLRQEFGFISDGGYAEFITIPERNAVPLPDSISDVQAAPIGCGVTTAVHAARLTDLKAHEWAVVYGAGAVGFGLIQLAKAVGARVIAVGRTAGKLEKAAELGAELCIDATKTDPVKAVRKHTNNLGADVIFECVGSPDTMPAAVQMLGRRGRLMFIGYTGPDLSINPIQLIVFEQQVMGSVGASLDDLYTAVDLVARGVVRTVVDRVLPLDEFAAGIKEMQAGKLIGKAVLVP